MAKNKEGNSNLEFVIRQTKIVDQLIKKGKIFQANRIVDELLKDFPNDKILLQRKGRLNLYFGNYEEALNIYLHLEDDDSILKLAYLGIKFQDMDLLDQLYYEFFGNPYYHYDNENLKGVFMCFKFYMDVLFGVKLNRSKYSFYETRQIIKFNKQEAINYIVKEYQKENSSNKSKFDKSIDITLLYEQITDLISNNLDKSYFKDYNEYYVVKYINAGSRYSYIHVNTLIGTSNIFLMYPIVNPCVKIF